MEDLKLSRKNAILAKCHECQEYYKNGKNDCSTYDCPLYAYMPFGGYPYTPNTNFEWLKFHPKRKGRLLLSECGKSEEAKQASKDRYAERVAALKE